MTFEQKNMRNNNMNIWGQNRLEEGKRSSVKPLGRPIWYLPGTARKPAILETC